MLTDERRPPRGGVDRNQNETIKRLVHVSRPPRGGVDRNLLDIEEETGKRRRPPRGGVDRNDIALPSYGSQEEVAPRAGAWIETTKASSCWPDTVSPPARGVDRNW